MKKRKLQKLALHKHVISNLEHTRAGLQRDVELSKKPIPGACTIDLGCVDPKSVGPDKCITQQGYGFPCSWLVCAP